jgi:hypothetical protein
VHLAELTTTAQRFEYKYLVNEPDAGIIRDFVAAYMDPDKHADPASGSSYPVLTVYLDSPDMFLYYGTVQGEMNRFKLRIRYYDQRSDTPAFIEIKRRVNDVIVKQRAAVRKAAVHRIVGNCFAVPDDLDAFSGKEFGDLTRFCETVAKLGARPRVAVHYQREAYVGRDGSPLRVTLDRGVACSIRDGGPLGALDGWWNSSDADIMPHGQNWVDLRGRDAARHHAEDWVALPGDKVVLEIKFTDSFPSWCTDMVRAMSLKRTSAAKYVRSVDALVELGVGAS